MLRLFLISVILFNYLISFSIAEDEKPIIGVFTALTGDGATYGQDIRDTLIFANEKLAGSKYSLDFQDDRCDLRSAVDIAKYFSEIKRPVATIGYPCSGPTLAALPIMNRSKLLTMVTVASSPLVSEAGEYIFRSVPHDRLSGTALANWVIKTGIKKVGVISSETEYCMGIKDAFAAQLRKSGIEVLEENVLPATTDFRPFILRLRRAGVEGIFLNPQFESGFTLMLKDLDNLHWRPRLFGAYYPSSPALLNQVGSQLEGIEFVDLPKLAEILNSDGMKLLDEYRARFGPLRSYEAIFATVFEGFRALHLALEGSGDPKKFLSETKFDGIFGKYSFDKQHQIEGFGFEIKKIVNNKVVKP